MPEQEAPFEVIDVSEVKPEDVGTLSLRYVDGAPQLVLTGGTVFPTTLQLVNGSGNVLGAYTANPAQPETRARSANVTRTLAGTGTAGWEGDSGPAVFRRPQ
ncbi:hypothetical protein ACFYNN_36585 [Streptomyces sp. NPDC006978]|uniref:hypothetical protein n=1 Tax=Streptomyces sp. NPDC006978 TaxID=3364769 RepID=UPI00369F695B